MSERSNPDPFVIQRSRTAHKRVKLNVGGVRSRWEVTKVKVTGGHSRSLLQVRHEIMWSILDTVPTSRLGMLASTRIRAGNEPSRSLKFHNH